VLHPLTLSFRDAAVEAAWWAHFARERGRLVQGGIVMLLLLVSSFTIVDRLAFPEIAGELLRIRVVTLLLLALPLPLVLGPGSQKRVARFGQPVLAWLAVVALGALYPMGLAIVRGAGDDDLRVAIPALLTALIGLYGVSGLRFAWAAPIGLGTVAGFFLVFWNTQHQFTPAMWWTAGLFAGGMSVVGLVVCWSLEYYGRRDFLRQRELEAERERSESLLRNIVPDAFAERLGREPAPLLDRFGEVTIVFATLVDYEEATRDLPPLEAVALLDRLVASFDELATLHGVERIKTVGATYMAASGLPTPRADAAQAAARMVIAMRAVVELASTVEQRRLRLRVGMATGPVMAGVIGRVRYAFDCWGDTTNTASRMDTHGLPGRVQVDANTAERVADRFRVVPRGPIEVKGKGAVETFWLESYR
jgi:class 3 adenylate cyclase